MISPRRRGILTGHREIPPVLLDRVVDGKIVEHRGLANEVDFMRQLGIVLEPRTG